MMSLLQGFVSANEAALRGYRNSPRQPMLPRRKSSSTPELVHVLLWVKTDLRPAEMDSHLSSSSRIAPQPNAIRVNANFDSGRPAAQRHRRALKQSSRQSCCLDVPSVIGKPPRKSVSRRRGSRAVEVEPLNSSFELRVAG